MTWFKRNLSTILLVAVFFIGLGIVLYPSFSDYWNSFHQTRAIAAYTEQVAQVDDDEYARLLSDARSYNAALAQKEDRWELTDEDVAEYESLLDVSGTGIMGYVEIPEIDVKLPIYHGTDEGVLQIAIGHIEGSSLPVGGVGTHTVLSGHRGLPSAKLFTDLDELVVGDTFLLRVLDETLTYEVDQILIVEPTDITALALDPDQDYCTLVTCTPYGVNSHRLLVRGHRVANAAEEAAVRVSADAMQMDTTLVASLVAVPILLVLLAALLLGSKRKKKAERRITEKRNKEG